MKWILSFSFIFLSPYLFGQNPDSVKRKQPLEPSLTIAASISDLGYTIFHPRLDAAEFQASLGLLNYFLTVDYGYQDFNVPLDETVRYSSSGSYFRVGPDVNFLAKKSAEHSFLIGFRYAQGFFGEQMTGQSEDPLFGQTLIVLSNAQQRTRWLEGVVGLRTHMGKGISLGWSFRWRFANSVSGERSFSSYYVPGYGREELGNSIWFNYYITYTFDFKTQKKIIITR